MGLICPFSMASNQLKACQATCTLFSDGECLLVTYLKSLNK